ncbi:hypothetical protein FA95DRAFT_1281522 [Auriscalpium vulgare]|uniref:Uncharacterized protein n=1 Tax=Auriscalpium vulgare TaxID=40419 RepID=A0ACB8RSS3_9AGAM|nr:hypothetical protein FA95DRAFT_1281522 [Auriscalpium vulgare]
MLCDRGASAKASRPTGRIGLIQSLQRLVSTQGRCRKISLIEDPRSRDVILQPAVREAARGRSEAQMLGRRGCTRRGRDEDLQATDTIFSRSTRRRAVRSDHWIRCSVVAVFLRVSRPCQV